MRRGKFAQSKKKYPGYDVPFLRGKLKGEGAKVKEGKESSELVGDRLVDDVLAIVGFLAA